VPPSIERFSVAKVMDISEFAKEKRELFCFFPKKTYLCTKTIKYNLHFEV